MVKKETRKGSTPIKVYCLSDERQQIDSNARAAGLSLSSFLLKVGMGYQIKGVLDCRRIEELAKINADLGRLGGLLKLWLTNDEKLSQFGYQKMQQTIVALVVRIAKNQEKLREIMLTVVQS